MGGVEMNISGVYCYGWSHYYVINEHRGRKKWSSFCEAVSSGDLEVIRREVHTLRSRWTLENIEAVADGTQSHCSY